jgi:hypothetical protein
MPRYSDELVQRLLAGFRFEKGTLALFGAGPEALWTVPVGPQSFKVIGRAAQKAEPWSAKATLAGKATRYRLSEGGAVMEGTVSDADGGGDMEIDDVNMTPGKIVTVVAFSLGIN